MNKPNKKTLPPGYGQASTAADRVTNALKGVSEVAGTAGEVTVPAAPQPNLVVKEPGVERYVQGAARVRVLDVTFTAATQQIDRERVQAAILALFDTQVEGIYDLHTGHLLEPETHTQTLTSRKLVAVQKEQLPTVRLAEKPNREVQRLLREWLRLSVQVDLLFYEPSPDGTRINYAWRFRDSFPTSTGTDEVFFGENLPEQVFYHVIFDGDFEDNLDGAIALAQPYIAPPFKQPS